ncbi:MAG: NAD(P)/FAD-dependent oxidoreductase [Gammaproteobacteria bacterium]
MKRFDTIIIGAGAAGLMCAIEAGKRKRKVLVLDHANKVGKKILMSGGGRCNFTNYNVTASHYLSHNPHFCKSALSRYTPYHFIDLVKQYKIPFHEKTKGQLFCDNKSQDIVDLLLSECKKYQIVIQTHTTVEKINKLEHAHFNLLTNQGTYVCESLVIATGGLSIPTMGASPFGYKIAEQFNLKVWPTRAGLVPLTLHPEDKEIISSLSGISVDSIIQSERKSFDDFLLFTHRGLSGPSILQISSYWEPGETISINLLPQINLQNELKRLQKNSPNVLFKTVLSDYLPKRLVTAIIPESISERPLQLFSHKQFEEIALQIHSWKLKPNGTEGYRTAEVTIGGVDCDAISSKTMEANQVPGLYFIGEILDVTGWLGGYNFQWAWASGFVAGQFV